MEEPDIPKFKNYAEGEPIPPVDPEDLRRWWDYERTHTRVNSIGWQWLQGLKAALSPEAEFSDVSSRHGMITTLTHYNRGQLLAPWHHGEELHEAVFRIAATFPLRHLKHKRYMIAGDEHFGFDPNAFVQKLIEETGIAHVWEPIETSVPEGGSMWVYDEQDGGPIPTVVVAFYQRFKDERGSADASDWDASRFGMYLLEHIEEVEQLLNTNVAYPTPEPSSPMDSE